MTVPVSPPADRVVAAKVFVRGLALEAEIGVYAHEHGRRQPLVVDVELDLTSPSWAHIADTINYEPIAEKARAAAAEPLREAFHQLVMTLGRACLEDPRVSQVRVRVEKPLALAPDAAAAGAELVMVRT